MLTLITCQNYIKLDCTDLDCYREAWLDTQLESDQLLLDDLIKGNWPIMNLLT